MTDPNNLDRHLDPTGKPADPDEVDRVRAALDNGAELHVRSTEFIESPDGDPLGVDVTSTTWTAGWNPPKGTNDE